VSRRSQAVSQATSSSLAPARNADRHRMRIENGERYTIWSVYQDAIDAGWGATCRLCLILLARWGAPVAGGMKLVSILLGHPH
jgi:hypothetical protein